MEKDMQVMFITIDLLITVIIIIIRQTRKQIIQINNTIINNNNNNTRINSVFRVLTTVNLLLPTPVFIDLVIQMTIISTRILISVQTSDFMRSFAESYMPALTPLH
jgi:hypothetical protein